MLNFHCPTRVSIGRGKIKMLIPNVDSCERCVASIGNIVGAGIPGRVRIPMGKCCAVARHTRALPRQFGNQLRFEMEPLQLTPCIETVVGQLSHPLLSWWVDVMLWGQKRKWSRVAGMQNQIVKPSSVVVSSPGPPISPHHARQHCENILDFEPHNGTTTFF